MICYIILGLGILSMIVFLSFRVKATGIKALSAKATTSFLFICIAAAAIFQRFCYLSKSQSSLAFAMIILVSLCASMLGDVFLDLKWIYPAHDKVYTYSGFIWFMVSHLLFIPITCVFGGLVEKPLYIIICFAAAIVITIIIMLAEAPLKMVYGSYKTIIFAYSICLSMALAVSVAMAIVSKFNIIWVIIAISRILFFISDIILSGTYFSQGKKGSFYIITNHVSYYLGQFMLAGSLLLLPYTA